MVASRVFAKTALESAFIIKVQRALRLQQGSERLRVGPEISYRIAELSQHQAD
jgi:hypothetical protein